MRDEGGVGRDPERACCHGGQDTGRRLAWPLLASMRFWFAWVFQDCSRATRFSRSHRFGQIGPDRIGSGYYNLMGGVGSPWPAVTRPARFNLTRKRPQIFL